MIQASEDVDDEEEDDVELTLEETLNETSKLVDLKAMVKEHKEFKKLRKKLDDFGGLSGPRELKPLMYKALGIDVPAKAKKKAKVKKEPTYSRSDSTIDAIKVLGKKEFEMADLITKADEFYVENGGDFGKVTTWVNRTIVAGLVGFGILEKDKRKYKFTELGLDII